MKLLCYGYFSVFTKSETTSCAVVLSAGGSAALEQIVFTRDGKLSCDK